MPAPNRFPIESFSPWMVAALTQGSRRIIAIPCEANGRAHYLRTRFNTLRKRYREAKKVEYPAMAGAKISVFESTKKRPKDITAEEEYKRLVEAKVPNLPALPKGYALVVISPHDQEFIGSIQAAGIDLPEDQQLPELPDGEDPFLSDLPASSKNSP